ncbi:MAG: ABC transporter substrate-binding protein, partial [Hyphomicrobium sp.]
IVQNEKPDALVAEVVKKVDAGTAFVVVDAAPKTILAMADALKGKPALVINAGSPDERLREEDCRANVKHTIPSRAMFADALVQYLTWKRWSRWFLIVGPSEEDRLLADAYRRSAKRFGAKIIAEKTYTYEPGSRRSDGGFARIQQQMPSFTQDVDKDHDIVVVVDEGGLFGEYVPYRTWHAKPVVGTAGLYPVTWHPAVELWGGTQFQNRFRRMNNRSFRELDYNVWMAIRSIGEAATRKKTADGSQLIAYLDSPDFELAAFKGQKLTYRKWNGQLRQPILLVTGKLHVTVSPQPGFLHQFTELDTLGIDKPESKCKAFGN